MRERIQPPRASDESTPPEKDERQIILSEEEVEAGRNNLASQDFVQFALEQEKRLKDEGRIDP